MTSNAKKKHRFHNGNWENKNENKSDILSGFKLGIVSTETQILSHCTISGYTPNYYFKVDVH